jgi:hypothetical protein
MQCFYFETVINQLAVSLQPNWIWSKKSVILTTK